MDNHPLMACKPGSIIITAAIAAAERFSAAEGMAIYRNRRGFDRAD